MKQYLWKSESIQVELTELEYYMLGPEDANICIESFAEGARDEFGCRKFVLLEDEGEGRGADVADAVRFVTGADHVWTARDGAELRQQEETDPTNP